MGLIDLGMHLVRPGHHGPAAQRRPVTDTDVSLARNRLCRVPGSRRGPLVVCLKGVVWLTQRGDEQDYILTAGDWMAVHRRGMVLVQALRDAQVRISWKGRVFSG